MYLNNFLLIFGIFISIYFFLKKTNLLKDNVTYSSHKVLGLENKTPIILGGLYVLISISIFYPIVSININIALALITLLGLLSDKNILPSPKIRFLIQILILIFLVFIENLSIRDLKYQFLNELLSSDFFNLFFLVFCLAILLNGSNFLDGLNGLVSGYYIIILLSLLFLNNHLVNRIY